MKSSKKIIVALVVTVLLSVTITYLSFQWLVGFSLDPSIETSISKVGIIKLFIIWLIYFFASITLPFLLTEIVRWTKMKNKDWWKAIIGLELLSFIFSSLVTSPDLLSTILFFLICQIIVIVNGIVLKRKLIETN